MGEINNLSDLRALCSLDSQSLCHHEAKQIAAMTI